MYRTTLFLAAVVILSIAPSGLLADCGGCAAPISTFPHYEDFESAALCGTGCGASCSTTASWTNITGDNLDWLTDNNGTSSSSTGPSTDFNPGTTNGRYLYVEASCSGTGFPNKQAIIHSSCYDFTNFNAPIFELAYHMYGVSLDSGGLLEVEVSTDNCTTFDTVFTDSGNKGNVWKEKRIPLAAYGGESQVHIRIKGTTGNDFYSDMAVDNLNILGDTLDLAVVDANVSPLVCAGAVKDVVVTVVNRGGTPQSNFEVSYNFDGGENVTQTVTSVVNGGDSIDVVFSDQVFPEAGASTLNVAVAIAGDASPVNDTLSTPFTSVAMFKNLPIVDDFEDASPAWFVGSESTNSSWEFGAPANTIINTATSGEKAWVTNLAGNYNDSEQSSVVSPCFDFTDMGVPVVALNAWWNTESNADGAALQSSIDGGSTWQTVGRQGAGQNWYNHNNLSGAPGGQQQGWTGASGGWVRAKNLLASLGGYPAVLLRVAFGSNSITKNEGFAFDDFEISSGATATKTVSLLVDNDQDGRVDPGDTLRYVVEITNDYFAQFNNVLFDDEPESNLSLVVGSVTVDDGIVVLGNTAGDTKVQVAVNPLAPDGSASISFDMQVAPTLALNVFEVCNQGVFSGDTFQDLKTTNPALAAIAAPTCIAAFTDSDNDGEPDGGDQCTTDPNKVVPGICGCGVSDKDSDSDGIVDCNDQCPEDAAKTEPGVCGCGQVDADVNGNGTIDCLSQAELISLITAQKDNVSKLQQIGAKTTKKKKKAQQVLKQQVKSLFEEIQSFLSSVDTGVFVLSDDSKDVADEGSKANKKARNATKSRSKKFKKLKRAATKALNSFLSLLGAS